MTSAYETVIGLEVHAQLLTQSKLFCADSTTFGEPPNTLISAISLAHPGTLPKLNKKAIELAVKLGIATNCEIVQQNYFARKNYFYPDLPKGFQISQHTTPICRNGKLEVATPAGTRAIRINRIHMEEDAGKSIHDEVGEYSNLDFNRAGMPLVEIVTEPDIRSEEEAAAYLNNLRKLVRHLDVCDGNMEEGSFRCDVNISVRRTGEEKLGTKVEIKNLNSVRFMKKAIAFERELMIQMLERGEKILQQTKGFDDKTNTTYTIRIKEDEDDYRYFPEPDLPPFFISDEWINSIKQTMPQSNEVLKERLSSSGLTASEIELLITDDDLLRFFEALASESSNMKAAANWTLGPIRSYLQEDQNGSGVVNLPVHQVSVLIRLIDEEKISYGIATQKVLPTLAEDKAMNVEEYISKEQLWLQKDEETDQYIEAALQKHADKIKMYKQGKKGLISVFVGEVMKLTKGKADARKVTDKIMEKLKD